MTAEPSKLSCPICQKPLHDEPIDGVTADLCTEHGLWLDKDELRQLVERIKLVEMRKARRVLRTTDPHEIAETAMTESVLGRWWNRF